ncbi:MAG: hypothetical protein AB7Q97_25035 [Gammaproteobacteria bacterium]
MNGPHTMLSGAIAVLLLGTAPDAVQALAIHDDRPAWLAALPAGPAFSEDFEGFAADTPFAPAPLAFDAFTVQVTSAIGPAGQFVDVAPFAPIASVENPTSRMIAFVDGDAPGVFVDVLFPGGARAWGADFQGAATGEGLTVTLFADGLEVAVGLARDDGFIGFVLDPIEAAIERIRFGASTAGGDPGFGEAFAIDDIAGIAAPARSVATPPALALVVLGAAAGVLAARRRA